MFCIVSEECGGGPLVSILYLLCRATIFSNQYIFIPILYIFQTKYHMVFQTCFTCCKNKHAVQSSGTAWQQQARRRTSNLTQTAIPHFFFPTHAPSNLTQNTLPHCFFHTQPHNFGLRKCTFEIPYLDLYSGNPV